MRRVGGVLQHLRQSSASSYSSPYQRTQQGEGAGSSDTTADPSPAHRADDHPTVVVASLVLPNVRGNKEKALQRVIEYTRRAAARGAEIIVAPETCLVRPCPHCPPHPTPHSSPGWGAR